MVFHTGNIVVHVAENQEAFNKDCATNIMEQINQKPDSVVCFATGSTPIGVYKELVSLYKSGRVDFGMVTSFNLDEYYPIRKDNPQSYYSYMEEHLFKHVNIKKSRVHIPNGEAEDADIESAEYENKIKLAGPIDYQIMGIGTNGHIGFNEPDSKFPGKTHLVTLKESTIQANSRFFDSPDDMPKTAITMGIKTIMSAKKILLMAIGRGKAAILKEALFKDITPSVPASVLQLHTNVMVVVDQEAAAEILPLLEK